MFKIYFESGIFFTFGVILFFLGMIIFRENPKQRINRVTGTMLFLSGFGTILGGLGSLFIYLPLETQIELESLKKGLLIWEFFFPQLLYFSFIFPREQKIFPRIEKKIFLIFLPYIFHFLIVFLFNSPDEITNIAFVEKFKEVFGVISIPFYYLIKFFLFLSGLLYSFHNKFFAIINILYVGSALIFLHIGFSNLQPSRFKRQVALVIWGLRSSVGIYTIAYVFPLILPLNFSENLKFILTAVAVTIGAGSISWAIIRYKFLDIQIIIRKSIVFSISSGLLVGSYLLVYNQIKKLSSNIMGDIPVVEIAFIVIAVLLFQPILAFFERLIERIFVKERETYQNILESVSRKLMVLMDIGKLVSFLKNEVKNYLMLERIEVFLKVEDSRYVLFGDENTFIKDESEIINFLYTKENLIAFDQMVSHSGKSDLIELLKTFDTKYILSLKYRGKLEGFLCLGKKVIRSDYSIDDITFLNLVSNQITSAIENARLYEETLEKEKMKKELHLARNIQNALLPKEIPKYNNFELSAMNIPSQEVGGDYFDILQIEEDKVGIAIGDISGKGVPGALLMSNLQASVRTSVEFLKDFKKTEINKILFRINNHLVKSTSPEQYATFFYGVIDQKNNSLIYSNAGHNYPILLNKEGNIRLLKKGGMALGFLENYEYDEEIIKLKKGDIIIFYTDGVTEALNLSEKEFSEVKLVKLVQSIKELSADEIKNSIYQELLNFTEEVCQYDDITLLVLKVRN
ncbi:PP2C family protein-serine/threonine phosphatase [candidate division KSB1 bacterium]